MKMILSFKYAFEGIATACKTQPNFRAELIASLLVVAAGCWLHVSSAEWLVIALNISIVLSLELVNTAIESTCDLFSKEYHPSIKFIKDIAAAAVLIAGIAAAVCGVIIFLPKIIQLF
jgi:diacylglycerol kinase